MARIRTIKPDFWSSGQVLECSTTARLLFIGLWNFCDDHGRHPLRPKQIKAQIFPADDISTESIRGLIDELASNGLLQRYVVEGEEYLQVTGWHHQRIDKRQEAKYPEPPEDNSTNDPGTLPPEGKGGEGKVEEGSSASDEAGPVQQQPDQSLPAESVNSNGADPGGSDEDRFWHMANELEGRGVARSRLGQLANLLNGDFAEGLATLRDVAGAREPSKYLGAIIRDLKADATPAERRRSNEPAFIQEFREAGYPVEKLESGNWRCGGAIYDERGEQIGQ